MLGLKALGLGDAGNIGVVCLGLVAGPAEDLKVIGLISPAEG